VNFEVLELVLYSCIVTMVQFYKTLQLAEDPTAHLFCKPFW